MGFFEAFETLKSALKTAKATEIHGHLAVEIELMDEDASGICYLEVTDGVLRVEPYNYYDSDARIIARSEDLAAIFAGKLQLETALAEGRLWVEGDTDRAMELTKLIKKPARQRSPAKKADKPATEPTPSKVDKPAVRKTTRKKASAEKPADGEAPADPK